MKLHQKGFLLVRLREAGSLWDHELVAEAMAHYGLAGLHWVNTLRVALEELAAAGLVTRIGERLDDGRHVGPDKVLFNYRLSEFGRGRMRDTGLWPDERTR
jgi:hypothetical protein